MVYRKRSSWKGILFKKKDFRSFNKKNIYIKNRSSIITPIFIGYSVNIYNGINYVSVNITDNMIGHKFGEFSFTRKKNNTKKKS